MNIQDDGIVMTGMQKQQQQQQQLSMMLSSPESVLSTSNQLALAESREQSNKIPEEKLDLKSDVGARGFCLRDKDEITCQLPQEVTRNSNDLGKPEYLKEEDINQFDVVFVGRGGNGYQSLMEHQIHRGYIWSYIMKYFLCFKFHGYD